MDLSRISNTIKKTRLKVVFFVLYQVHLVYYIVYYYYINLLLTFSFYYVVINFISIEKKRRQLPKIFCCIKNIHSVTTRAGQTVRRKEGLDRERESFLIWCLHILYSGRYKYKHEILLA